MPEFHYEPLFQLGADETEYRRLDIEGMVATTAVAGREILSIDPEALRLLAAEAVRDVSHLFRASHLAQLRKILDDPEARCADDVAEIPYGAPEGARVLHGKVVQVRVVADAGVDLPAQQLDEAAHVGGLAPDRARRPDRFWRGVSQARLPVPESP